MIKIAVQIIVKTGVNPHEDEIKTINKNVHQAWGRSRDQSFIYHLVDSIQNSLSECIYSRLESENN